MPDDSLLGRGAVMVVNQATQNLLTAYLTHWTGRLVCDGYLLVKPLEGPRAARGANGLR
jgi:hypothetical protein